MNNEFKVEVDQNNIIHLNLGNLDTHDSLSDLKEWAEDVKRIVMETYEKTNKKVLIAINITNLKKYETDAFLILTSLMKANKPYVLKSATFGGEETIILAQKILCALSGRHNFEAFTTKEKALTWLIS